MTSPLETQIRNAIAAGFKGQLLTGTLVRSTGVAVDEYGDPINTTATYTVSGFVDNFDERYRAQAGIPETDSRITLILGNSETEPQKDDVIDFANWPTFQVREVKIDPARASAVLQVFNL